MKEEKQFEHKDRPSAQQLYYLMELERMGQDYGSLSNIAQKCGVSPSAVSRFMKKCIQNGYLTEKFSFTPRGREWYSFFKKLYIDIIEYLERIGTLQSQVKQTAASMFENIKPEVLHHILYGPDVSVPSKQKEEIRPEEAGPHVHKRYQVYYKFFRMAEKDWRRRSSFSMANNGFENDAWFCIDGKEQYLELQIKEMRAASRATGKNMVGHMQTLKYEDNGNLVNAEVDDGKVNIPIRDCRLHHGRGGEITGTIPITVTCSIGRLHMPESTALLVFWL